MFSLISGSHLLKQWKVTYNLDICSAILISGSHFLKHWKVTHVLEMCSAIAHPH